LGFPLLLVRVFLKTLKQLKSYEKTLAKLIIQKYSRLKKFLIRSYLIDNEELKILITKKIEVE
jgi:hypothetical protein